MMSQASVSTREGGGRPAVGEEHSTSHSSRKPASTTSGGRMRAAMPRSPAPVMKGARAFAEARARVAVSVAPVAITRPS